MYVYAYKYVCQTLYKKYLNVFKKRLNNKSDYLLIIIINDTWNTLHYREWKIQLKFANVFIEQLLSLDVISESCQILIQRNRYIPLQCNRKLNIILTSVTIAESTRSPCHATIDKRSWRVIRTVTAIAGRLKHSWRNSMDNRARLRGRSEMFKKNRKRRR